MLIDGNGYTSHLLLNGGWIFCEKEIIQLCLRIIASGIDFVLRPARGPTRCRSFR